MHILRTITVAFTAVVLLAAAPGARAQSQDELALLQTFLSIMSDYYGIIESTYEIASDPEKAAILQMSKIQEVYEERGQKVRSTEVLKKVLEDSRNPTIRNAAYMLMGDTLKEAGRGDEALEFLQRGLAENIEATQ